MMSWFVFTGWKVTEEQLEEVAQLSDVLACDDDFLSPDFRAKCEQIIPDPLALDVNDCAHAFRYLRDNIQLWYFPNIIFIVITQRWLHFMNSVLTKNWNCMNTMEQAQACLYWEPLKRPYNTKSKNLYIYYNKP